MLKRGIWVTVFLICSLYGNTGKACSCGNTADNFIDALRQVMNSSYVDTQMAVVECKYINNIGSYGTAFQVLHRYYTGAFALPDTVVIWGDPGWCCRFGPRGYYHIGDTILAIINSLHFQGAATGEESANDFYIYSCNYHHVRVHHDSVFGGGAGSFTFGGYPLSSFLDSINEVLGAVSIFSTGMVDEHWAIYPNPARNMFVVPAANDPLVWRSVTIVDVYGRVAGRYRAGALKPAVVDVSSWARGIYFVRSEDNYGRTHVQQVIVR